jgi:hypothetical protein
MFTPIPLNLPPCSLQLTTDGTSTFVLDGLRKKKLVCTPEEWVRQHWIHFLIAHKNFPKALIQSEGGLKVNMLAKRTDLILFNREGKPILLAEFKSPFIPLGEAVVNQILRYNSVHQIPYLLISNGLEHRFATVHFEEHRIEWMVDLPVFEELI